MNGASGGRQRAPRPSLLDPFKAHVRARLARFDLPATVLLREIQRQGYGGGISVLKEFAAAVKTDSVRAVVERFETMPGVQPQATKHELATERSKSKVKPQPISITEAKLLATNLAVDAATRARLRVRRRDGGPREPQSGQPKAPQGTTRPSTTSLADQALEHVQRG